MGKQATVKKQEQPAPTSRIDIAYKYYRIIAGEQDGACRAIAYIGMRRVAESRGDTIDGAVTSVRSGLEALAKERRLERRDGVPTAVEFKEALEFLQPGIPTPLLDILSAHRRRPQQRATVQQLASLRVGWNADEIEAECAKLGRKLSKLVEFLPRTSELNKALLPMLVIAVPDEGIGGVGWRLRPEITEALGILWDSNGINGQAGEHMHETTR